MSDSQFELSWRLSYTGGTNQFCPARFRSGMLDNAADSR
jgi:hypothetical protein